MASARRCHTHAGIAAKNAAAPVAPVAVTRRPLRPSRTSSAATAFRPIAPRAGRSQVAHRRGASYSTADLHPNPRLSKREPQSPVKSSGAKLDLTGDSLPDGHARAGFSRLARQLSLHIAGVGADDLVRGAGAADAIFLSHGMAPAEADHGRWRRDLCEALGLADDPMILSRRDALAASVWDEAVRAAVAAARPGSNWASCPDAQLRLNQPLPLFAVEISP